MCLSLLILQIFQMSQIDLSPQKRQHQKYYIGKSIKFHLNSDLKWSFRFVLQAQFHRFLH
jgi:hypothetical protein